MSTNTLEVSAIKKNRESRRLGKHRVTATAPVRSSRGNEAPRAGKGFLLGRLAGFSLGPSTYDPAQPAFGDGDWIVPRK